MRSSAGIDPTLSQKTYRVNQSDRCGVSLHVRNIVRSSRVCAARGRLGGVSDTAGPQWLTIPDLVTALGITQSQVRRLIEDRALLATRVDGVLRVPAEFIKDGEPLGELRGTIVVLGDAGFTDDEAIHWLLTDEDSLGIAPIAALRAGRKAEVRRVAQALGF